MSTSTQQIYLVTGATRGIGLALVAAIAAKDTSGIVYAGGRNTSAAQDLVDLAKKYPGRIELVKYVAGDQAGNEALAREIQKKHGHIDVVIANAGISKTTGKVHETTAQNFEAHFATNVVGPIVLFQAFHDLLKVSSLPRFIAISSGAGSLELLAHANIDNAPYGMSKAALNWVIRKIHYENEWLVTFPQCPGPTDTDMYIPGNLKEAFAAIPLRKPDDVANALVEIFAVSTRDKDGGQFHNVDGGRWLW
ncbi:NAD(P)-binding protein [Pholiota conissans]|uniref:NAD(P)-binding protein n=1 Tax=Pholiota conissans TaxID=109636 RepID=A0A9P5YVB7_9AGAR|nr:NAD(P)-binding protein [Pholiota conissans]